MGESEGRRVSTFRLDPDGMPDSDIFEGHGGIPERSSSPCDCMVLLITKVMGEKVPQGREDVRDGEFGRKIQDTCM